MSEPRTVTYDVLTCVECKEEFETMDSECYCGKDVCEDCLVWDKHNCPELIAQELKT